MDGSADERRMEEGERGERSILELRKEKSRDAARSRRGKENYEFYELAKLLPLPAAITSQLDKASIIRLTISYLRLRDFSCHGAPQWTPEDGHHMAKMIKGENCAACCNISIFIIIIQSLDGFAFILANDGRFLYISETVSIYLGLSQVEMAGSSIFDYVHPDDHSELVEYLDMCLVAGEIIFICYTMIHGPQTKVNKSFSVRMKSTLTKRGVHVKTSGYRVCWGYMGATSGTDTESQPQPMGMVGMAIALPPPTITELRLELDTFITRLSPDFKIVYCEPIINDLMDLRVDDVTDRLLYDLCHPADLKSLQRSHTDILRKGQALTDYYRLMNRTGGFVWVQTCATTLLNSKNSDDQSILAINYVVSGPEEVSTPMDVWQLTGDVSSVMSSACDSAARRERLLELKANDVARKDNNNTRGQTKASKRNISACGSNATKDDKPEATNTNRLKNGVGKDKASGSPKPEGGAEVSDEDHDDVFHAVNSNTDAINGSSNSMNKRRKMDKPKKHARNHEQSTPGTLKRGAAERTGNEPAEKALNLTRHSNKKRECSPNFSAKDPIQNYKSLESRQSPPSKEGSTCHKKDAGDSPAPTTSANAANLSLTPEDLSMKRPQHADVSTENIEEVAGRNIIQHSSFSSYVSRNAMNNPTPASGAISSPRLQTPSSSTLGEGQRISLTSDSHSPLILPSQRSEHAMYESGSSVQDLEVAMNRHLPSDSCNPTNPGNESTVHTGGFPLSSYSSITSHSQADSAYSSSTSGLPGRHTTAYPSGSSPTGGSAWLTPPRSNGSELLTASNFLRSLYAASTRESVIKTGGGSGIVSSEGVTSTMPRGQFINNDLPPSTLLTPPEPDPVTYRVQSRGKDAYEESYKNLYSYRDSFSHQTNFPNHQHHSLGGKDFIADSHISRNQLARSKELFSPSPFLPIKDYSQSYQHHQYFPISGQIQTQIGEYPHQQNQQSNLRSHLNQSFNNSSLLPPSSSSSTYKTHPSSSTANPPSTPYKDVIPTFNIPSLMSPTTPGPVTVAGTDGVDGESVRRSHEEFHHSSVNFTLAHSPPSHQLTHPQQHVDSLSMTPPASASPDPTKVPSLPTHCETDTFYPSPATHPTGRQAMNSNSNLNCFPYQHPYSNTFGRNPSEGVIKRTMYSMGSFMDLNQLNSGSSQYESYPRPVLSWH
ncbi:hypothetical protein EGW08_003085 [Elysia chlorotica]|uniref:Uncharacterized protein n=1 Tax=Elysia chlorotica TaxID=188477 RepID=A0A3S0ZYF4_ELYCH|nr:hypothetical protein EGW08_003085 [Elysia chlorotica]